MEKRKYTHIQVLLPEIKGMLAEGKTQREVAEHYGFKDKQVVKRLLERERRKERKMEVGILPRPKGRPRKGAAPSDIVLSLIHIFSDQILLEEACGMGNRALGEFHVPSTHDEEKGDLK